MYKSKEFDLSVKKITINGKSIVTPKRAIYVSQQKYSEAKVITDRNVEGLSETFKKITKDKLEAMNFDSGTERKFTSSINNPIDQSGAYADIHYFLFHYDTRTTLERKTSQRTSSIPTKKETEYLCDLINNSRNDFIVPPLMPYLNGDQYIDFLGEFLDVVPSFDSKQVGGLVSSLVTREDQSNIIDFYKKNKLNIILFDLYGSSPDRYYPSINMLMRNFKSERFEDEDKTLLSTNVRFGRPRKTTPIAPAKDLLSPYAGFDSFGRAHVMKIGGNLPPNPEPSLPRVFERNDYGYYLQIAHPSEIRENLDVGYIRDQEFERMHSNNYSELIKALNALNQGKECNEIEDTLSNGNSMTEYLRTKRQMPEKIWKEFLTPPKQHDLDEYFF